jgi:hypothetical protein
MSVLRNAHAIAMAMGIIFREMFAPTVGENYPNGPGPLKAHISRYDTAGCISCSAMKMGLGGALLVSRVRRLALPTAST